MEQTKIEALAAQLGYLLAQKNLQVSTAESCTGGGISFAITSVSGSSAWFEQSLVTYSNEAKERWLKVPEETLRVHGAVSEPTVIAMVKGLADLTNAGLCIAVSGIAGPTGGSADKPVGMVWLAWSLRGTAEAQCFHFEGDREEVRLYAVEQALMGAVARLEADKG